MKIIYLFLFLFIINISTAQEAEFKMCSTDMVEDPDKNGGCVEYFDYFYDYLDHVQIHKPVFHFVNYNDTVKGMETIIIVKDTIIGMDTIIAPDTITVPFSLPSLQFVCIDDPSDPQYESDNNAFLLAKELIFWANKTFAELQACIPGGAVLPNNDFKVRYTDIDDCNDIVIVENGGNIQPISGKLNFHIFNLSNTSFGAMGALNGNTIELKNIGNKIIHPNKSFFEWQYGPLINHEIGHEFGLCHAQSSGNTCADYLNSAVCDTIDPSCYSTSLFCESSGNNNTMISGAATQRGMSPCQFTEAFIGMVKPRAWRTTYLNDCLDIVIDKPQETTYIECDLYVCSKLIVKTGSEVVLRGSLIMNQDAEIVVERGARFVLDNGIITGNIKTPGYWKGITLNDGYTDQVPITTPIADYPALAPSSLVAEGNINGCYIEYAETAIASRGLLSPGAKPSLIDLKGFWIRLNEVGLSINNYLNERSINAILNEVYFTDNTKDDLIIIAARDIDINFGIFFNNSLNGITLIDTELSSFNNCTVSNREIGMDILCTYPFHPGFEIGGEENVSNHFTNNDIGIQIGGGIGVANTQDMLIYRGIFRGSGIGIQILGASGYEVYKSNFPSVWLGILSAHSGMAENVIHCNDFSDDRTGFAVGTIGNNQNLTIHSNEFDMADELSMAIRRYSGDIFQVQSADFDEGNTDVSDNPPAGNQFFDVGFDLFLSDDDNKVDYLVPQPGAGSQYYPQTTSNYNSVLSTELVFDCPVDDNLTEGTTDSIPDGFEPNDSTDTWQDPIGDPVFLDDYLDFLIHLDLGGDDDTDGHTRSEIARVRFALYRWVVYMLNHPTSFNLSVIENFVDDDYQRLLVGYYIHKNDPYNADRILASLPRINEINQDFAMIQEINLKRLFPAFYNLNVFYVPTSTELLDLRAIAEKYSENTGYASALYYLYTHEKVYPDFDLTASYPRNGSVKREAIARLDIYPNPTAGSLVLTSNEEIYEYALYDSYGQLKLSSILKGSKNHTLDVSTLSEGLYFLTVNCGSKTLTRKVVKL